MAPVKAKPPSVTAYLLAELARTGLDVDVISESRPGYGDPWKNVLMVHSSSPFTIWVVLFRRDEHAGKVQVEGFSEPFSPCDLPQIGPKIVEGIAGQATRSRAG